MKPVVNVFNGAGGQQVKGLGACVVPTSVSVRKLRCSAADLAAISGRAFRSTSGWRRAASSSSSPAMSRPRRFSGSAGGYWGAIGTTASTADQLDGLPLEPHTVIARLESP